MSTGLHGAAGGGADQVMYTCDMEAAGPFRSVLPAACPVGRGVPRCRSALTAHGNLRSIKIDSFEGGKQDLTEGFSAEQADQLLSNLFVEAQLMEGDVPIGLPSRTIYSCYGDGSRGGGGGHRLQTRQCRWNDLLTFRLNGTDEHARQRRHSPAWRLQTRLFDQRAQTRRRQMPINLIELGAAYQRATSARNKQGTLPT